MWLAELVADPVIFIACFCTTASSVSQSELELRVIGLSIYRNQIVIIVKFFDCWEVSVLLAIEWHVRFRVSVRELDALFLDNTLNAKRQ